MRNKKVLIFIAIIGTIISIVIFLSSNAKDNKLSDIYEIYDTIRQSKEYIFEMQKNEENKLIVAQKDDKTIIDQYSNGSRTTTLEKDNVTYLILHDREEYYVYEQEKAEQNILIDGFAEIFNRDCLLIGESKENIMGKKYNYEEYEGSSFFMLSNNISEGNTNLKNRFYFDRKGNLSYIKTMYGEGFELLKVNIQYEVEDSIFEIPSNYAENEN